MLKYEIMEYALSKELSRTSNIEEVYENTKKLFGSRSDSKCKNVIKFLSIKRQHFTCCFYYFL